jgi:hypothetical protein
MIELTKTKKNLSKLKGTDSLYSLNISGVNLNNINNNHLLLCRITFLLSVYPESYQYPYQYLHSPKS